QLKDFLGLTFEKTPAETLEKLWETIVCMPTINFFAFGLGIVCLLIMVYFPRIKYVNKVPPSLVVVVLASAAVALFEMPVNTVGSLYEVKSGFPAFSFPTFTWKAVGAQIPNAFIIAFLAAVESLLSCVVADGMVGDKHNPNTELIAQGAGNMASALFGGIPATGAIARTAANVKNGGRSPVSGMVHALVLLLVLLFAMPLAALIPMPAIAAILLVVAYNMSEWRKFVKMTKTEKADVVFVLVITCVLTVAFDLVVAIAVGLGLSLIFHLFKKHKAKKDA
ncbi:MAG: sodium-independent anion transporter, partial [Clostridia bacterium]|nr:sodium-independent anion transporter [Clostridia bacterium]